MPGSRLSEGRALKTEGVHTWANTEAIHFLKKYQNNHLAYYKSVSASRDAGGALKPAQGLRGRGRSRGRADGGSRLLRLLTGGGGPGHLGA